MSSGFIDFQEVKDAVSIERTVELLGLQLIERNGQLRGECSVCGKGGPRALCVTPKKGKWYCFGCQTGGDQIALAAHIRGEHPKDAAHWLMGTPAGEKKTEQRPKPTSEEGFQPLPYLQHDHEAVEALGFEPKDAEIMGIGYAPKGMMRGQVAVPVRLPDGRLVGYIGITDAVLPKEWKF